MAIISIMIFWTKKKKQYPKIMKFGSKLRMRYGEGQYYCFLTVKIEDSEHMKIIWTDSLKEDGIIIKNILLNYSKKECR